MVKVFTGPNSYQLKKALREAKAEFIKQYGDLSIEVIDGEEASYEQVVAAIESVPFLAQKKLLIIYNPGSIKEASEHVEDLVKAAGEDNELIIVEPKLDKRSAYCKYLQKNTDMTEFSELDERELAKWVEAEAKKSGAELNFADAYYLVQRVGANQQLLSRELRKLIDYSLEITKVNIDALTEASPQTTIFNLLDSAFGGNSKKAMEIYNEQRIQGEEPLKIFAMLVWQMHLVALVDAAAGRSDAEIMKLSGLKPFTLNKSRLIARRMGKDKIKKALSDLVELDRRLKYTSVDADDAVKSLLLSIS